MSNGIDSSGSAKVKLGTTRVVDGDRVIKVYNGNGDEIGKITLTTNNAILEERLLNLIKLIET